MSPVNYAELDPGIRDRVRILNEHGFETTDSGDGVSKRPDPGEVLRFPHVAAVTEPARLISDAESLFSLTKLVPQLAGGTVEASYNPDDGVALLLICWPGEGG